MRLHVTTALVASMLGCTHKPPPSRLMPPPSLLTGQSWSKVSGRTLEFMPAVGMIDARAAWSLQVKEGDVVLNFGCAQTTGSYSISDDTIDVCDGKYKVVVSAKPGIYTVNGRLADVGTSGYYVFGIDGQFHRLGKAG